MKTQILLLLVLVSPTLSQGGSKSATVEQSGTAVETVKQALACIWKQQFEDLRALRLRSTILYRFTRGPLPQWGSEDPSKDTLNLIVYSEDRQRGLLAFATRLQNGTVNIIENRYALQKSKGKWEAGGGSGGVGTYELIGQFVDSREGQPVQRIRILDLPPRPMCCLGFECTQH
jgi:hypothetical protein